MKLRAKVSTQFNGPKGLIYVNGPEVDDEKGHVTDGDVIDVPDSFVVNPDVFEVGKLGGPDGKTFIPFENRVPGVRYVGDEPEKKPKAGAAGR